MSTNSTTRTKPYSTSIWKEQFYLVWAHISVGSSFTFFKSTKILHSIFKKILAILKVPQPSITTVANYPARHTSFLVVVDDYADVYPGYAVLLAQWTLP